MAAGQFNSVTGDRWRFRVILFDICLIGLTDKRLTNWMNFRSRKISSAPVPLESSKGGQPPVHHRRAWSSSDQMESIRPSNNVDIIMPTNHESSGNENSDSRSTPEPQQQTNKGHLRNPSLHVHSISYPAWPSLSETDPAIELIRSIKEELKKFEPKVS